MPASTSNTTGVLSSSQAATSGAVSAYASTSGRSRRPCDSDSRYVTTSSRLSVKPALASWRLFGSQTVPPDHALVPPTVAAFSNSPTRAPSAAARTAAVSPAAPVPSTTTSYSPFPAIVSFLAGLLPRQVAAVHGKHVSHRVAGLVRAQPQHRVGDLI